MKWIGQITYDEVAYFREDVIIEAGNKLGIGTASPGGNGGDLELSHDGSISTINNYVGTLSISQLADDGDIRFQSDDGAGGVATYFSLDGSGATHDGSATTALTTNWPDNSKITLGNSNDLQVFHNATDSYALNGTGNFYIANNADDKDLILQCDDGTGSTTAYLTLDGSDGFTKAHKKIRFLDNAYGTFGNADDLSIHHDGSNSLIDNITGHLYIYQKADDKNISFQCDDGSGGNTEYLRFDGAAGHTVASKEIQFLDNVVARFGNGNDMSIQHNANDSLITNNTGDLYIQNTADDKDIIFQSDNGAGGNATYFSLDGSAATHNGSATTALYTSFPDNSRISLGSSGDYQMFHSGSHGYLRNYTGDLYITQYADDKDIVFYCDDGSGGITAYLTLDGSATKIVVDKDIYATDNVALRVGTGGDLRMLHTGTDSMMVNTNGDLYFNNQANDKDIIFKGMDNSSVITALTLDMSAAGQATFNAGLKGPSGGYFNIQDAAGNATYPVYSFQDDGNTGMMSAAADTLNLVTGGTTRLTLTNTAATFSGALTVGVDDTGHDVKFFGATSGKYMLWDESADSLMFPDSTYAQFGTSGDLSISHNGSTSLITNYTGDLKIVNNADDKDIIFQSDDGAGGVTPYLTLDGSAGNVLFSVDTMLNSGNYIQVDVSDDSLKFADNAKAKFGTSNDLQIYHDGTNNQVLDDGSWR
jgi:hypothetical protein